MTANTVRLHRVIRATPDVIYRAFLDRNALSKWLPPHGFFGTVDHQEPQVGGTYHMSFTQMASGYSHSFAGKYLELVPGERLRYSNTFDDPNLAGELQTTVTLRAVSCGTEMHVVQEGIPDAIPVEQCYVGWQQSLQLLMQLVEADVEG